MWLLPASQLQAGPNARLQGPLTSCTITCYLHHHLPPILSLATCTTTYLLYYHLLPAPPLPSCTITHYLDHHFPPVKSLPTCTTTSILYHHLLPAPPLPSCTITHYLHHHSPSAPQFTTYVSPHHQNLQPASQKNSQHNIITHYITITAITHQPSFNSKHRHRTNHHLTANIATGPTILTANTAYHHIYRNITTGPSAPDNKKHTPLNYVCCLCWLTSCSEHVYAARSDYVYSTCS